MNNYRTAPGKIEKLHALAQRHDALPQGPATPARLKGLPAITWNGVEDKKPTPVSLKVSPKNWKPNAQLPQAEVVVMTWTTAEWAAMNHVFCDYANHFPVSSAYKKDWREPWYPYAHNYYSIQQYMEDVRKTSQGGVPSLYSKTWGAFRMVKVAGQRVLLIKSGMHLAQDGTGLPLRQFVRQICEEAEPDLVLSIGTGGGVRAEDALGCALITNQAYFHLLDEFKNADFNGKTFRSSWTPPTTLIKTAQKMVIQVPGYTVLPPSPQYPKDATIKPDKPNSWLKIVTDKPIITTDTFLFGTTKNKLDQYGCIVEMDDAVIGMICEQCTTNFGFVRNVSDPVINGNMPSAFQKAWANYIYEERGIYTSFNGALGTWAVIAGA